MTEHTGKITFYGVRGSTPCADTQFTTFGGHTSCVMLSIADHHFIFDTGSGAVNIPPDLNGHIHIFYSHVHLDHILGLPFLKTVWNPNTKIHFYNGTLGAYGGIQRFLTQTFTPPLFPVPFEKWPCVKYFHDFKAGDSFLFAPHVTVHTFALNHPNGATAFRVHVGNKIFAYVTDHEHTQDSTIDQDLIQFLDHADCVVYDSSYDDHHFDQFKGWGHSTWQQALRLQQAAHIKRMGIFHHDPRHDDARMKKIQEQVEKKHTGAWICRQDDKIDL